jgi:hypothetical protein
MKPRGKNGPAIIAERQLLPSWFLMVRRWVRF